MQPSFYTSFQSLDLILPVINPIFSMHSKDGRISGISLHRVHVFTPLSDFEAPLDDQKECIGYALLTEAKWLSSHEPRNLSSLKQILAGKVKTQWLEKLWLQTSI